MLVYTMCRYEWGAQQSVMLIKSELQRAGYTTWMDIDKMSGVWKDVRCVERCQVCEEREGQNSRKGSCKDRHQQSLRRGWV